MAKNNKSAKNKKPASKSTPKSLKSKEKTKTKPKVKAAGSAAKMAIKKPVKAKVAVKAKPPAKPVKKVAPPPAPAKVAKKDKVEAPPPPVVAKGKAKDKAKQLVREALTAVAMAPMPEKEVVLTNADGMRYCKIADCDELSTSDSYCRFHYLLNWKKIQLRKRILAGDKLDRYIEELTARYPDKYLEMIRKDLASEKDFLTAIQELEIDDSGDDVEFEDDARTYIDEVRGVTTGSTGETSGSDDEF